MGHYRRIELVSMMLDTSIDEKIESYHTAEFHQYQVAECTTDDISEVGVDILSVGIQRRDLITNTFASTNISYNTGKKPVLMSKFDPFVDDYVVVYFLQMTCMRSEFIYHLYGCIEEVYILQLRIPPIYHTITSFKCAQMRNPVICL